VFDVEVVHVKSFLGDVGYSLGLDLYRPVGAGVSPVTLYFHGGGWTRGDRQDRAPHRMTAVAAQGIAVASVDYRLSQEAIWPAQLDDAKAALRWLRVNGPAYGLATGRIGAWGASAGGQIALMLAVSGRSTRRADGDQDDAIADAVVAWFPPVDLFLNDRLGGCPGASLPPFITEPPPSPSFAARLVGATDTSARAELARDASPLSHVDSIHAPVLLFHGDADGLSSDQHSRIFHHALKIAGGDSTLLIVKDANHEDPIFESPAILGAVSGFFHHALSLPA
jgi:acetyl esterase/lipase